MKKGRKEGIEYKNGVKAKKEEKKGEKGFKKEKLKTKDHTVYILDDGMPYEVRRKKDHKGLLKIDGKNSFKMPNHPVRSSTRPQKFFKPPLGSSIFYNELQECFDHFEVNVDKSVTVEGCLHTNKVTLQRQMIPEVQGSCFTKIPGKEELALLDESCRNTIRKLQIEELPRVELEDIDYVTFNTDTQPGFHYQNLALYKTKKECIPEAKNLAEKRWMKIKEIHRDGFSRNELLPSLYTIGARNKRDFTYDDGEDAGSRVVHMPEFHVELCDGGWSDTITSYIKLRKRGPIYIGNNWMEHRRLEKDTEFSNFVIEGDWKRYDSSLYLSMILCAISILRLYYDLEDEDIDKHFIALFDSLSIKDYFTTRGQVYRAIHGLPSGVKCTNLLGSIINCIALNYCINDGANKKYNFITGGDDFLVAVKDESVERSRLMEKMHVRASELGMTFKFLKCKDPPGSEISNNIEEVGVFYKYTVFRDVPLIPSSALLERVFLPWNKRYRKWTETLKFLNDVMPSLGAPRSHLLIFYIYYCFVVKKAINVELKVSEVYVFHRNMYQMMVERKKSYPFRNKISVSFVAATASREVNYNFIKIFR